ncbi:MAG: serpin family protein [Anaerolineales bacterium]
MHTLTSFEKLAAAGIMLALVFSACAPAAMPAAGPIAKSDLARLPPAAANPDDLNQLTLSNRTFALDLYRELRSQPGNLVFSPYSISLALAMTYAGAREETASQMEEALHFTLPNEQLHPAFNTLDQSLARLASSENGGITLELANSLWAQQDFSFLPDYLDLLAQNYGAGVQLVDYAGDAEAARQAINAWVEAQTHDKIQDLFKEGSLDPLTRLVLVNAIYFKAAWQTQFDRSATDDGDFHLLDGSLVQVPMMTFKDKGSAPVSYGSGESYLAVGLPYANPGVEMVILLPTEGNFETFEAGTDEIQLTALLNEMRQTEMMITMPRFKSVAEFSLPGVLQALGMVDAFGGQADFSGMDGQKDLFIGDVVHKAFVEVNEQGTEAAAATGVQMKFLSSSSPSFEVRIDHPFVYLIYDRKSGTILFMGRVLDPTH